MGERAEIGRLGREWLSLQATSRCEAVMAAFGLPFPIDPESDTCAEALALLELGICETRVIAEPRYSLSARKAARDAALDRDTIHQAPTWRYPEQDEAGTPALILPVGMQGWGAQDLTLSLHERREDDFAADISDLVALPLDGSRPLSFTGHTLAIGSFAVDQDRLVLHASPMAWLKAHLARTREITGDTPGHLIEQLHFPLPSPCYLSTLLIEPRALEWRVTAVGCVIPMSALRIVVPDSLALAKRIDTMMRQKERVRPLPMVCGPKAERAA